MQSGEGYGEAAQPLLLDPVMDVCLPLSVVTENVHHHLIK